MGAFRYSSITLDVGTGLTCVVSFTLRPEFLYFYLMVDFIIWKDNFENLVAGKFKFQKFKLGRLVREERNYSMEFGEPSNH